MVTRLRKNVTMLVTVSVPFDMTAADARREVKTLIKEQANYAAEPGDVKPVRIEPALPGKGNHKKVGQR